MLKPQIVKVTDIPSLEAEWRTLELRSKPSFFLTWTWIGPWAEMVSKHTTLYRFKLAENETPVAMCFFTLCKSKRLRGLITARQVQLNEYHDNGCNMVIQYNALLAEEKDIDKAWTHLFDSLVAWDKTWDEIAVSSCTEHDKIPLSAHTIRKKIDKTHCTWKVSLDHECIDTGSLLTRLKAKQRQQLRQSLKLCEKEFGQITLLAAEQVDQALSFFERMDDLHTRRWNIVGKPGSFANPKWVEFHKNVITAGFPRGEILLVEVRAGEQILGYIYGHVHANTAYIQQTGFITTKDNRLRPGYVSHLNAMQYCAEKGIRCYDFLPDETSSYKKFFTSAGEPISWILLQRPRIKFYAEELIRHMLSNLKSAPWRRRASK